MFFILGVTFLFFSFAPSIWYGLAARVDEYSTAIFETAKNADESETPHEQEIVSEWQPVFDSKLPRETRIKISEIGVDTTINEATLENYENALKKGVWRVSDFGTPADREKPMILAAHRFGYLKWSNLYRRKNSFYNLPKLENGDLIEITYKQRKYIYEIYRESRGEEIADYSADLILYTCESLNSKVRIFKYAKLLKV
jgi:sortase (surface protein transpeptidase)